MKTDALTREQLDLVELLKQELQTQLDESLLQQQDGSQVAAAAESLQNFGEAAELIGLPGLAGACRHLQNNFQMLAQHEAGPDNHQALLIDSWIIYLLDYLQQLRDNNLSAAAVASLMTFLGDPAWPDPLSAEEQQQLTDNLVHADITAFADEANVLPTTATAAMLSLHLNDDINPELFEGLMLELPGQVSSFADQITLFIASDNREALASAQRIAHTIKGSGNVVGVTGLANFMHFSEDLLEEIARYQEEPNAALKNLLIDMSDTLAAMLDCLLAGNQLGEAELQVMQQVLDAYHVIRQNGLAAYSHTTTTGNIINSAQYDIHSEPLEDNPSSTSKTSQTSRLQESIASQLRIKEETAQSLLRLAATSAISTNRLQTQVKNVKRDLHHLGQLHHKLGSLTEEFGQLIEVRELFSARLKAQTEGDLDPLELDRYNELHSFFHQLQEFTTDARDLIYHTQVELRTLEEQTYEQQVTNRESQNLLLEMRMIPADSMEARFQRCVRQACRLTNKQVHFELKGGDTMIDSRVLHDLVDPIMHLLRNAVDHGIEDTEIRLARGKSDYGNVCLSFRTQGQSILVHIADDGAGLDHQRIAAKAEEMALTPPDENHPELVTRWLDQLIFAPGFSTRTHVSQTSGRGIGLDMVADRVGHLKGRIAVESQPMKGCQFTIRLPMTMISEHGLLVHQGTHQLVVSSRGLAQLLFLDGQSLQVEGDRLQYAFDQKTIDVYPLARLTQIPVEISVQSPNAHALLIVDTFPDQQVGVLVESVSASREMVIKPLPPFTPAAPGVIGATILGDGSVAPVIDIQHLVLEQLKAGVTSATLMMSQETMLPAQNTRPMALVVDDSLSTRRSLAQFVGDLGMDVCTAKDGFEAVDILQTQTPSVILVDMEMPRMNGLELTAHVRANDSTRHIPIIMITSRNTEKHRNLARAAGVDNYLNKPFSEDELLRSLQTSLHG